MVNGIKYKAPKGLKNGLRRALGGRKRTTRRRRR